MRRANSELYVRKTKAEKKCIDMTRLLETQKLKSIEEKTVVVQRMRKVFERDTAVAVSDATVRLEGELKKTIRGVTGLKSTLSKTEVRFLILLKVRSPPFFFFAYLLSQFVFHCLYILGAK